MNKNFTKSLELSPKQPIYNKVGIFKICAAALAAILAVVSGVFFSLNFDVESMYFKNSNAAYIFGGITAAIIIAAIILAIFPKQQIEPKKCRAATLLQYLSALVLLCLFLQSIVSKSLLLVVFTLIAITYFLGLFNRRMIANTILGIGAVIFCATCIIQTYFDYSIAVNSPYKLLCQFGMAISTLLIASELRFELDDGKSGAYKLLSCLTFALNLAASIASITLIIRGAEGIHYCFIPCLTMTIYSAKIFCSGPVITAEAQNPDTPTENTDEKGTDTDENVN